MRPRIKTIHKLCLDHITRAESEEDLVELKLVLVEIQEHIDDVLDEDSPDDSDAIDESSEFYLTDDNE